MKLVHADYKTIFDEFENLIGEDDPIIKTDESDIFRSVEDYTNTGRNKLRKEIRTKLKELRSKHI